MKCCHVAMLVCISLNCVSCTGDPSKGGIFWSESKTKAIQNQKRQDIALANSTREETLRTHQSLAKQAQEQEEQNKALQQQIKALEKEIIQLQRTIETHTTSVSEAKKKALILKKKLDAVQELPSKNGNPPKIGKDFEKMLIGILEL